MGHSRAGVTQVYVERDFERTSDIMQRAGQMMYIFSLAVGASLWGIMVLLSGELAWPWKTMAVGMVVAALAMQFIPAFRVHFLILTLMQVAVGLWASLYVLWPRDI